MTFSTRWIFLSEGLSSDHEEFSASSNVFVTFTLKPITITMYVFLCVINKYYRLLSIHSTKAELNVG